MDAAQVTKHLQQDLLALGVRPGGVLLVHSSLSSLGQVPGGAETVVRGLLATLGETGTLLMPALSYETVTSRNPVF
ncbi:MAG: AAC(3) family N-acetyltransferase, partial [Anaerolineales bacterium]|nr:AAC(3) family N-acetyltransferase [Anaerolineales bacterium]